MSVVTIRPGEVLCAGSGRCYRLCAWHAEGSYARVFRAERLPDGASCAVEAAPCAIKVAKHEVAEAAFRLEREAAIRRQFRHPGVPELLDEGRIPPFLALAWVEGSTLRALLSRQRRLPLARALDLLRDVAEVVTQMHAAGLSHGDLRADNILVTDGQAGPRAVVADLGSARRRGEPEWEAAVAEDQRRLAVLLYQALTGVTPEQDPQALSTARGHHRGAVRLWETGSCGALTAASFLREVTAIRGSLTHSPAPRERGEGGRR